MPKLDQAIEKLLQKSGAELLLASGSGISLKTATGVSEIVRQPLTTQQIIGALTEIVPANLRTGFPAPGLTTFPYKSPKGPVLVKVELAGTRASASITAQALPAPLPGLPPLEMPETGADEPFELVPPSEMMHLAAEASAPPPQGRTAGKTISLSASELAALTIARDTTTGPLAAPVTSRPTTAPSGARSQIDQLLSMMLQKGASDLHLTSMSPPILRVDGDMVPLKELGTMEPARLKAMLFSIAPERNQLQWEQTKDTDFAYETGEARFRVNIFMDRFGIGGVLRQIPTKIRPAEEMGLSKEVLDLCFLTKGLVLVTGPTGSGKSTTLASMIDYINVNREDHIITIEDPIEFVHPNKKCLVNQREVGIHTGSFKQALRAALREDPDVVLVGEMRDLETVAIAIETAETGHLVFGTLHTNTAASTVDRIIDQFPTDRQEQVRLMLSESLKGIISQVLCKKIGGGRAPAREILLVPGSVANLIREGKTFQIASVMQTGKNQGMVTMNDSLFELVRRRQVTPIDAYAKAVGKGEFKTMLDKANIKLDLAHGAPT